MVGPFLAVVVLSMITHISAEIKPVIRIEGHPYILAIYDLHQSTDSDGNCLHQSRRSMEASMALQWYNEMLNQKTPNNIGLVVYDSCGSLKRTLKILGQHVITDSCNNVTDVVAVTTMTTREIDTVVSNMIRPLGMLHTAVSSDTYITSSSDLSLSVTSVSMWKSQAALYFLEEYQMEYVNVFAVNNTIAEAERNLFLEMAVSNKICANVINEDVNFLMNSSSSNITLMFVSGHDDLDDLLTSLTPYSDKTFLLIGDSNIEFVTTPMGNNTIILRESLPTIQGLLDYLKTKFGIFDETDSIFMQYFNSLPYCQFNATSNHTVCSDEMFKYLKSRSADRTFMSTLSAYYNAFRLIASVQTLNCKGYDFTTCQNVPNYVVLNLQQNPSGFPVRINTLSGSKSIEEQAALIFIPGVSPTSVVATISKNKILFLDGKMNMTSSKCKDICHTCRHCFKSKTDNIQSTTGYNGDILLTAGFPIYKNSAFGEMCTEISAEGVAMANSFLYAIDTVKNKHPTFLQGVSFGAMIYDTCGGRTIQLTQGHASSSCPFTSRNLNVTLTGKLVSNIKFISLEPFTTQSTTDRLAHFKVSPSGLSLSSVKYDSYLEALPSIFKSLNWTYVSVVYSEELKAMSSLTGKISGLRMSGICIFNEITINKNNIETVASEVADTTLKTGAIILLTSKSDTMKLIDKLQESHSSLNNVNFIAFAWNYIAHLPKGAIIIRPDITADQSLQNYIKALSVSKSVNDKDSILETTNKWLEKYHENHYKCHVEVSDNTIFPNVCTNQSTFTNTDGINLSLLKFIVDSVDATVSVLDVIYKSKCKGQTGLCEEFKSYSRMGSYIESTLHGYSFNDISFTDEGSLRIPLEMVNKQESSEVKVGTISKANEVTLSADRVFTYTSDGSAVQIQHQCPGWCSYCHQCQTSTTQTVDHLFTSGNINLVGMFPIHKEGRKIGTCGELSLETGSEYLTESFLYAVNTAKSRYPYLLPGIKAGSLIVDTCSDIDSAQQTLTNFESCFATFSSSNGHMASPVSVPGYLLYGRESIASNIKNSLQRHGRYALSHSTDYINKNTVLGKLQYSFAQSEVKAIVKFLLEMGWTHVSVISTSGFEHTSKYDLFIDAAKENNNYNICVSTYHVITDSPSMSLAIDELDKSNVGVVILFLSLEDIRSFFGTKILQKVHIISETNIAWNDTTLKIPMPLGTFVVERTSKINTDLKMHLEDTENKIKNAFGNPWMQKFLSERENCQPSQEETCALPHDIFIQSSSVVTETDIMLHAIHNRIQRICGKDQGMCKKLEQDGLSLEISDFRNINFKTDQEEIILNGSAHYSGVFQFSNLQASTMITVGEWRDNKLLLEKEHIKAYDIGGMPLKNLPVSTCVGSCVCININNTTEAPELPEPSLDPEMLYFTSSAKLKRELWVFVMLSIVCGGVSASMLFVIYVIYKTCSGLLNKRYIGLGLLLLVSVIAVYFSVLPFMFTPSEVVCASRYLVPGISYALMYATCLTKLMSLMSYKLIGLGGEISNINQFLTVAFMTAVQIAIGVQYVVLKGPFLETREIRSETSYRCKFDRTDFLVYLIYVMLLIVICALYSIMVRKEKKNMGEAVFILISSWISIIVWIAWVASMLTVTRGYVEPAICIGLIVCSTVIILTVFVPKLHKIVKLKYDVNKSGIQNGGYKIDTEFMFERPHTLPGGFRSSYNFSPQKTNPKSLTTFDSSLSY